MNIKERICHFLCSTVILEVGKRAWKASYEAGYKDGQQGNEPHPPPPKLEKWYKII